MPLSCNPAKSCKKDFAKFEESIEIIQSLDDDQDPFEKFEESVEFLMNKETDQDIAKVTPTQREIMMPSQIEGSSTDAETPSPIDV
mmetsp:Transcript_29209/g.33447  ORF Transcript_29209/g.33447 Transcript_29209/m.33447 type:complete len:86 (+) Transcript_29209:2506-2763(+)